MFAVTVDCDIVCVTRDIGKAAIVANSALLQGCGVVGIDDRVSLLGFEAFSVESVHIDLILLRVIESGFVNKCIYKLSQDLGELISDINRLQNQLV